MIFREDFIDLYYWKTIKLEKEGPTYCAQSGIKQQVSVNSRGAFTAKMSNMGGFWHFYKNRSTLHLENEREFSRV